MDAAAARAHLDTALQTHAPGFETFFLARSLGLFFAYLPEAAGDAGKEICRVTFTISDMLRNPQGSLHGGVMASAMDISMTHLVNKIAGPGATIEMKVQVIRPVLSGPVTCEGRFVKRGRELSFMQSRLTDPEGRLAALATATWKMLQP